MRYLIAALALASCTSAPAPDAPPVTITGEITRADHQTYREIPFNVPAGATRITINFSYAKDNRTVIDLGVRDPQGQRGWSGGNKSRIEIGANDATPSYRAGPLQPGEWKLVLGVPNIRDGQTSAYTATITTSRGESRPAGAGQPIRRPDQILTTSPGWYRGDFHAHTAHSDGSCGAGPERGPCPVNHTAEAAKTAGLDFIAITDHNTITQWPEMAALQAAYPETLLIPGTEITTFSGHANAIGSTDFLDFQLGSPRLPSLAKLFDQVDASGGFLSVNHPGLPSGEACMGCGWSVKDNDWSRVAALELINGSTTRNGGAEGVLQGWSLWTRLLNEGRRITAIGGSDNHDATDAAGERQSPIGKPTTVVYATELSTRGIVAGVKAGRVFIDVAGLPGATLDMTGAAMNQSAVMGGGLVLPRKGAATITATATGLPAGTKLILISNGLTTQPVSQTDLSTTLTVQIEPDRDTGWVYPVVRDEKGRLLLVGNPVHVRVTGG